MLIQWAKYVVIIFSIQKDSTFIDPTDKLFNSALFLCFPNEKCMYYVCITVKKTTAEGHLTAELG